MKNSLFVLAFVLLSAAYVYGQDTVTIMTYKAPSRGVMIKGKKNGVWTSWTADGKLISQGNYRNDTAEGQWTYYSIWTGDSVTESGYIHNGKWNGEWTTTRNGKYESIVEMKDGKRNGKTTIFWDNKAFQEFNYVNDVVHGDYIYYYNKSDFNSEDHVRKETGHYVDGKIEGTSTRFYPSGKIMGECTYVHNKMTTCRCQDESGAVKECNSIPYWHSGTFELFSTSDVQISR